MIRLSAARVAAALLAAVLAAPGGLAAPHRALEPVDEAPNRPDFFSFRAQLQAAVARRDVEALLGVVDPAIRNTFGPDEGMATFMERWRPREAGSEVWSELGTVLALGGSFQGADTFVAPYVFSTWPADLDAHEHVAVIGHRVTVRREPSLTAPAIGVASFVILRRIFETEAPEAWTTVELSDRRRGSIAARYVRSPVDYRAFFTFANRRWRMTAFVAGD